MLSAEFLSDPNVEGINVKKGVKMIIPLLAEYFGITTKTQTLKLAEPGGLV